MILTVDIGNTFTKWASFAHGAMVAKGSASTQEGIPSAVRELAFEKAVIGSVVPEMSNRWADALGGRGKVHLASHKSPWGFRIDVENPETLGIDRLANMEGALRFPGAVLVVDAGTATKFDLLEGVEQRSFPGGAIAPGLGISFEALLAETAQLPRIDLNKHSPVLGYNTETAIRSGVLHGFASQVDGMVMRFFEERKLPPSTTVVATGGNSIYLQGRARLVSRMQPQLTLEGLHGLAKKI